MSNFFSAQEKKNLFNAWKFRSVVERYSFPASGAKSSQLLLSSKRPTCLQNINPQWTVKLLERLSLISMGHLLTFPATFHLFFLKVLFLPFRWCFIMNHLIKLTLNLWVGFWLFSIFPSFLILLLHSDPSPSACLCFPPLTSAGYWEKWGRLQLRRQDRCMNTHTTHMWQWFCLRFGGMTGFNIGVCSCLIRHGFSHFSQLWAVSCLTADSVSVWRWGEVSVCAVQGWYNNQSSYHE